MSIFDRLKKDQPAKSSAPRERVTPWQYLKEVREELTKVTWPKRQEVIQGTVRVIVVSLLFAALLGAVDYGAQRGLDKLLSRIPAAQVEPSTGPSTSVPQGLPEGIPSPIQAE